MRVVLAKNWWSLVIRGLLAISVGLMAMVRPGVKLGTLVLLFGFYALIDGLVSFAGVMRAAEAHERAQVERVFEMFEAGLKDSRLPPHVIQPTIFIGHGRNSQWRDLADHLREQHVT